MADILAVDVGTTTFKIGVFGPNLEQKGTVSRTYDVNIYNKGWADIEPEIWWETLIDTCTQLGALLKNVNVITFSVTTPGLVPIAKDGSALGPAILFFDGRSHKQAIEIRDLVGEDFFLDCACNLPVSGGSSLCSILWIKENQPQIWEKTEKFGHCNTYMVRRLTGKWVIDPSTTSITGLYNTAENNLTWINKVLSIADIPVSKLPTLMHSYSSVGYILPEVAKTLGIPDTAEVLCGGNDAVLAALSSGVLEPGEISAVHGTADITAVCVDRPIRSRNFNLRCHVIPSRWLTFFVMNTGGKALDWFYSVFCKDLTHQDYYEEFIPRILKDFLEAENIDQIEEQLPDFLPFLQGSRYHTEQLTASFMKLTLETTREQMLLGLIKAIMKYEGEHLSEVEQIVALGDTVMTSGGAAHIRGFLDARKRWTGNFNYILRKHSSLHGAAMLGVIHQAHGEISRKQLCDLALSINDNNFDK